MTRHRHDICMAVISDLEFDARVWKEARSLAQAGNRIILHGCTYGSGPPKLPDVSGVEVTLTSLGRHKGSRSTVRRAIAAMLLWTRVLRSAADVYHAHNIHTGPPCWLASRLRGSRFVFDAHEIYGSLPGVRRHKRHGVNVAVERLLVRVSDVTITTNHSRRAVLERRSPGTRVTVLANVPSRRDCVEALDPGFPRRRRVLLYQGGIYARARPFKACIEALALLDDFDMVVIGFGAETELQRIRNWAADAGVGQRVHLLPPRPFDELVRTAAAATVGLVPVSALDLGSYLGDTNKLYEYLMAGLPVVASDLPEIRRVVTAGRPPVGELFDPDSAESIAGAVRAVVNDRQLYQARRDEARRLALERYNWNIEQRSLLAIYAELRRSRNGRGAR